VKKAINKIVIATSKIKHTFYVSQNDMKSLAPLLYIDTGIL